jgi:hypothetical protein
MLDPINFCADIARNHRDFVKCVGLYTTGLRLTRVITSAQKKAIDACASTADIP